MKECLVFIRLIFPYLKKYRRMGIFIMFGLLAEMAFTSAIPMCFKFIIDNVLIGGDKTLLVYILVGLSTGVFVVSGIGLLRNYYYSNLIADILGDIRQKMFDHIHGLSLSFFSGAKVGDLLSHFSTDLAIVELAVSAAVPWAVLPGLDVLASCVLLFVIDWRLALVSMLVWPVSLIGPKVFAPKVADGSYRRKQIEGATLSMIQENVTAQPVIKAFNLADSVIEKFREQNGLLSHLIARLGFFGSLLERSTYVGILFLQVMVIGIGAVMVSRQMLSIGSLAAFLTLFCSLSYSLSYVTQYVPTMVEATGGMRRIDELLTVQPKIDERKPGLPLEKLSKDIVFRQVSFGYTDQKLDVRKIDLTIERGKFVAFVGPSGAGKSTILNLAMRSYDPLSGAVFMDGIDLRDALLPSLRSQTAVVFQESFLFNTSIRENIRIGRLDATHDEIEAAARAAEIHDTIMLFPAKYDTVVGERGGNLSGGQRQRVAIARAILRNPSILILDEATSSLDPTTEASVNATLLRLSKDRTTLSATHRLSSVVGADRINYLDDGEIRESGTFEELMELNGRFRKLWEKQHSFNLDADGSASIMVDRICAIPIFSILDRSLIERCAQRFTTERIPPGRVVTAEGDIGEMLYIIVRGIVEVSKRGPDGSPVHLTTLSDGDYFGEIALIRAIPRTATFKTVTQCVFITMYRRHFHDLLKSSPELEARVEETVVNRLNQADSLSFDLSQITG